eukprot:s503_g34.t1
MGAYNPGQEVDCDDPEIWSSLQPAPGSILEAHLQSSSLATTGDEWAAFFIRAVETRLDGSILLTVHFMGATDPSVADTIATMVNRGARIHLCLSRPCITVDAEDHIEAIHVSHLRMWPREGFEAEYLVRGITGAMKKWVKELEEESGPKKRPAARTPRPRKPPGAGKAADAPGAGRRKTSTGSGLPANLRAELKKKLEAAKKHTKKPSGGDGDDPPDDDEEEDSTVEEVTSSPEPGELGTGTTLEEPRQKHKARVRDHRKRRPPPLEDTKDITTSSLSNQLTRQAVALAAQRKKEKKKKNKKKKSSGSKLAEALTQILTGSTPEDQKKKKKKKKRKRRVTKDGTVVSYSSTCSSSSGDDMEPKDNSDSDLEAPIRKRSRDQPGSVLALLTSHVREIMDQASLTELPAGSAALTGGVKIATYFALHVKPQFQSHQREMREMFSLAATMDLLRRGDVARVGDSLAARFMALHQALIDQNWSTARHMELHSMEDTSAGSSAPSWPAGNTAGWWTRCRAAPPEVGEPGSQVAADVAKEAGKDPERPRQQERGRKEKAKTRIGKAKERPPTGKAE